MTHQVLYRGWLKVKHYWLKQCEGEDVVHGIVQNGSTRFFPSVFPTVFLGALSYIPRLPKKTVYNTLTDELTEAMRVSFMRQTELILYHT